MPLKQAVVVLGASGDLARRKLIPALNRLWEKQLFENNWIIVGSGRSEFTDEAFRNRFDLSPAFARRLYYHRGIEGLRAFIRTKGPFDRIVVFLALPPRVYAETTEQLASEGFGEETSCVIEKPFGYDYASARQLNRRLAQHFSEDRIYRIDHYLAKEAVQNLLVFRFANSVFYPVWNSGCIESIQINACEDIGVGSRAAYFDRTGSIRDMVQNHLMQMLCLTTMEAPVTLDAEEIRSQKLNILKAITVKRCCRMQYEGYRDEEGVDADSTTETFAELELAINTFRWSGMPVYIRTGKALNRRGTEIGIRFKALPKLLFNRTGAIEANRIIFKIQPAEGIIVDLATKIPGNDTRLTKTHMAFCYRSSFQDEIPEAYQKLLLDVLNGDRTLFVGAEETECSWTKLEPFLDKGELGLYKRGTTPPCPFGVSWIDFEQYQSICR